MGINAHRRQVLQGKPSLNDITVANQNGLRILMVFTFFMVVGFEMIMPLIVGQFVNIRGFSATSVAAALAVRRFTQQGLALMGGALADKWNVRKLISIGVLLRAVGFIMLAYGSHYSLLLLSMIFIGLGGVFFEMPYQTAIAILTTDENRAKYYSLNNTVTGVASTAGPLVGALLLTVTFSTVCYGAAACFLINFFVSVFALPKILRREASYSVWDSAKVVVTNKGFLIFVVLMTVFWLAASQIDISFPLKIQKLTGNLESTSFMYAIYAAVTAALQYPLVTLLLKKFRPVSIVVIGIFFIAFALFVAGIATGEAVFLTAVVLFSIGMLLARPNQQMIAVALADKRALGMFLGFNSLSTAIGCGIGNIFGGVCFDLATRLGNDRIAWYIFTAIAVVSLIGFIPIRTLINKKNK